MRYIPIKQSSPRHIADTLDVKAVAQRLAFFSYAETRLMDIQAGWLVTIPIPEIKVELSYHLFEDMGHADAMRDRLPQVGAFGEATRAPNGLFTQFCNELANTDDLIERFVGLYQVLRPHLARVYREHVAHDDSVADYPTVRILERAAADHEKYAVWGQETLATLITCPEQQAHAENWCAHLTQLLEAAGGVLGTIPRDPPSPLIMFRNAATPQRFLKSQPVRDSRFRVETYERHEGRAATDIWDKDTLVKYMFMTVEGEIEATENCGRTLADFPDAPWELRRLIARQLWDEARHTELSMQRFFEMGGTLDMLPVRDTFPLYLPSMQHEDLARRLVNLNQVIEGWVMDDFAMAVQICRGLGDERTARLFEYLIADEWLHIKIGADWLPKLTANDPTYRSEIVKFRTEREQDLYATLDIAAKEVSDKHRTLFSAVIA
jgi:hypothetical protein